MTEPTNQEFVSGTTITSQWLNGVNDSINMANSEITGSKPRPLTDKLTDTISIKDFGALGNGSNNDSNAEIAAHLAADSVLYPYQSGESYAGLPTVNSVYGTYENALFARIQSGLRSAPTISADPILFATKYSNSTREIKPNEWDAGALYGQLVKIGGSSYGAAVTGNVRHESGTGQMIGVHGRGSAYTSTSEVWGGWFYGHASSLATEGIFSVIGVEIDMNNDSGVNPGWLPDTNVGATRGLLVSTADNSQPCTIGISIQAGNRFSAIPEDGFYTGLLVPTKSIRPSSTYTGIGNGEAIRLNGSPTNLRYGGLRFYQENFHYGISFVESTYTSNCAILLGDTQRISVGTNPGTSKYIELDGSNAVANFSNLLIRINNTQVVSTRKTGWGVNTGTATRTAFDTATVTLPQLAERVKAVIDDLKAHGLIGA